MPFRLVLYNEDQVHVIKLKKNKIALRNQSKKFNKFKCRKIQCKQDIFPLNIEYAQLKKQCKFPVPKCRVE